MKIAIKIYNAILYAFMTSIKYYVSAFQTYYIPLICESRLSSTSISSGYSGIQTVKRASPVYVPYFTITDAFDDPRISEPSTYTELHDDDTYTHEHYCKKNYQSK